jgi:hypothetical protein
LTYSYVAVFFLDRSQQRTGHMQLIATRRYALDDHARKEYAATDRLYRMDDGRFELRLSTDGLPGEPDSEEELCSESAFDWLNEMPEQIEFHAARHKGGRTLIFVKNT